MTWSTCFSANVRVLQQVLGDLEAQVVSNHVSVRRVVEFLEDTGLQIFRGYLPISRLALIVRRAAPLPRFRTAPTSPLSRPMGLNQQTTRIVCTVTVSGETMHIELRRDVVPDRSAVSIAS